MTDSQIWQQRIESLYDNDASGALLSHASQRPLQALEKPRYTCLLNLILKLRPALWYVRGYCFSFIFFSLRKVELLSQSDQSRYCTTESVPNIRSSIGFSLFSWTTQLFFSLNIEVHHCSSIVLKKIQVVHSCSVFQLADWASQSSQHWIAWKSYCKMPWTTYMNFCKSIQSYI